MFNSLWYQRRISNYKLKLANKLLLYIPSFLLENVVSMSNYHWVINERALSKVYTVLESIWERKSDCSEPFLNLYKELSITLMHISHINREASISLHVWLECSRARDQPFSQYRMARAASVSNRVMARKLEREQKTTKENKQQYYIDFNFLLVCLLVWDWSLCLTHGRHALLESWKKLPQEWMLRRWKYPKNYLDIFWGALGINKHVTCFFCVPSNPWAGLCFRHC